jgi:hypothetical protein
MAMGIQARRATFFQPEQYLAEIVGSKSEREASEGFSRRWKAPRPGEAELGSYPEPPVARPRRGKFDAYRH